MKRGEKREPVMEGLLTRAEAAIVLGVEVKTLANWAAIRVGPRFIRLGTGPRPMVRYRPSDLQAWLRAREIATEAS
jgi:hypothetical protein